MLPKPSRPSARKADPVVRVVLDANVFVSGVISSAGAPAEVLDAWRQDQFQPVVSPAILEEMGRVLRYPRIAHYHKWPEPRIESFIEDLSRLAVLTPGKLSLSVINTDPTDNRYIECAIAGSAGVLAAGDKKHLLPIKEYRGIPILSPAEFLMFVQMGG